MSITRVTYSPQKSSPTFAGKIKKTQSGNTYERTNKGKLISTSIGAGLSLASFACCAA